ncbi:hypothetical protein LshimejAT787_0411070 [Lyophyllum shimeji]|uniref:Uncharacterized protein n=1 Tax=Lyophyllum shimeji TaxID=47721 RepID=A0A9P3PMJ7_LYOSH|nr:hypothetical protein LshimejAT787_0411070 [Lyophyllum shimeji]
MRMRTTFVLRRSSFKNCRRRNTPAIDIGGGGGVFTPHGSTKQLMLIATVNVPRHLDTGGIVVDDGEAKTQWEGQPAMLSHALHFRASKRARSTYRPH